MIKAALFDSDGVLMIGGMFSEHLIRDFKLPIEALVPFFKNDFKDCLAGKRDLKEAITPYFASLKWEGTVDDLLDYWFKSEHKVDEQLLAKIQELRKDGVRCYLATNQEQYRTNYIRHQMGFAQLMDGIFSSAEIGFRKPQSEFYQFVLTQLHPLRPEEIAYWDDSGENIEVARRLGIDAHLYTGFDGFMRELAFIDGKNIMLENSSLKKLF